MLVVLGTWPGILLLAQYRLVAHRRRVHTYDLIWANFTPAPALPLSCFSDQVNLAIVEDLVTVW